MANRLRIYKEADKVFTIRILGEDGEPFPVNEANEIKVVFPNEYSCEDPHTVVTQSGGQVRVSTFHPHKFRVSLTEAQTAKFRAGENQSFEVVIRAGDNDIIVQFREMLDVVERLFPGA